MGVLVARVVLTTTAAHPHERHQAHSLGCGTGRSTKATSALSCRLRHQGEPAPAALDRLLQRQIRRLQPARQAPRPQRLRLPHHREPPPPPHTLGLDSSTPTSHSHHQRVAQSSSMSRLDQLRASSGPARSCRPAAAAVNHGLGCPHANHGCQPAIGLTTQVGRPLRSGIRRA